MATRIVFYINSDMGIVMTMAYCMEDLEKYLLKYGYNNEIKPDGKNKKMFKCLNIGIII